MELHVTILKGTHKVAYGLFTGKVAYLKKKSFEIIAFKVFKCSLLKDQSY